MSIWSRLVACDSCPFPKMMANFDRLPPAVRKVINNDFPVPLCACHLADKAKLMDEQGLLAYINSLRSQIPDAYTGL